MITTSILLTTNNTKFMKIIAESNITNVIERSSHETLEDFIDDYATLQYLLATAQKTLNVQSDLSIQGEEIKVVLNQQDITLDEANAAWFFAWVMPVFTNKEGRNIYSSEIKAFSSKQFTIVVRPIDLNKQI